MLYLMSILEPYYENQQRLAPWYTLSWNATGGILRVQVQVQAIGWVGFGIHKFNSTDEGMTNADVYIGIFNETVGNNITDRFSSSPGVPLSDEQRGCPDNILVI